MSYQPPEPPPGPPPAGPPPGMPFPGPPFPEPTYSHQVQRRRPSRAFGTVAALAGVGVVLVVGVRLVDGLTGAGSGADSPEGAVQELASAASDEDVLGAMSMLPPEEVRRLDDVYQTLADEASGSGWTPENEWSGFDVEVDGLELEVEELGDRVAKVTVLEGEAEGSVDSAQFSEHVQGLLDEPLRDAGVVTVEDLVLEHYDEEADVDRNIQPFVMTVQHDGRWYVSPSYTAMEYARQLNDLPAGDFGEMPDASELGADSPEAVVTGLADALETLDVDAMIRLAPPSEAGVLYAYRDAIDQAIDEAGGLEQAREDWGVTFDELETETNQDGDLARVVITSSAGTVRYTEADYSCDSGYEDSYGDSYDDYEDEYDYDDYCGDETTEEEVSWTQDGACGSYESSSDGDSGEGCMSDIAPDADDRGWDDQFDAYPLRVAQEGIGDPYVVTVQEDGRWYLSPVGTLTDLTFSVLSEWEGEGVLERALFSSFGVADLAMPDGTLAVDETVTARTDALGIAVYEVEGSAEAYDLQVCTSSPDVEGWASWPFDDEANARAVIYGEPNTEFQLQATEDYDCDL